jgi:uncharacterized protein YecE (DUF72 family)
VEARTTSTTHDWPDERLREGKSDAIDTQAALVFVGCAGWAIAGRFAADFPGEGTHLERYGQVFNAVEINSSFYRSHMPKTYAKWRDGVPPDFRFSVKMPRDITHFQRLLDVEGALLQFGDEVSGLQEKLGCVLIQLPPSLRFDQIAAKKFFTLVKQRFPCLISFEARHPTWFGPAPTVLLTDFGITRVIADPAKGQTGKHIATSASSYRRLHGSPKIYYSAYGRDHLTALANGLASSADANVAQWIIFDNTAEGAATCDALTLQSLLKSRSIGNCPEKTRKS